MHNPIHDAFGTLHAPERLKRTTKAALRKRTFDYGRDLARLRSHRRRLAGGFLSLALVLSGLGLWFLPTTAIGLDINPSLEVQVNALDRVIRVVGCNADGDAVARNLKVTGMAYDEAMQRILLSDSLMPYLEDGSLISITVAGGSDDHGEEILSKVVCRAYAVAENENVLYSRADRQTMAAAHEAGMSVIRYQVWQMLLMTDPAVTAEDVGKLTTEQIRELALFEVLENPCGE